MRVECGVLHEPVQATGAPLHGQGLIIVSSADLLAPLPVSVAGGALKGDPMLDVELKK